MMAARRSCPAPGRWPQDAARAGHVSRTSVPLSGPLSGPLTAGPLPRAGEGAAWARQVHAMGASRCCARGWFGGARQGGKSGLVRRRHGWRRRGDLPLECSRWGEAGRRLTTQPCWSTHGWSSGPCQGRTALFRRGPCATGINPCSARQSGQYHGVPRACSGGYRQAEICRDFSV